MLASGIGAVAAVTGVLVPGGSAQAQSAGEVAKELSNSVAAQINLPFQYNYDQKTGPQDQGKRPLHNIQPVIAQRDIFPGAGTQTGTGDVVQTFFLSPEPTTTGPEGWGRRPY